MFLTGPWLNSNGPVVLIEAALRATVLQILSGTKERVGIQLPLLITL